VLRAHLAGQPSVGLRLGHAVTGLTEHDDGVTVAVRDDAGRPYEVHAEYVVGCDGYGGVTRDQIGARYAGNSDPRPNFNVVFRAPGLDTPLGPEFHNLGLVLGYSYAGSPVVQPGGGAAVADVRRYTPSAEPGTRLPHCWLPDGSSLYDKLGDGFTLVTPAGAPAASLSPLPERARALRIPLTMTAAPDGYPWQGYFLVRPDQHIAWRADDPAGIDLAAAAGHPRG